MWKMFSSGHIGKGLAEEDACLLMTKKQREIAKDLCLDTSSNDMPTVVSLLLLDPTS